MVVKTYYSTGRVDVFDSQTMTDATVFPGNVLTNYALDMRDARHGPSLWLDIYYYEIDRSGAVENGPRGLPIAPRRDACCCILADSEDLKTLQRVTVDGADAIARIGGQFVDCLKLEAQSDLVYTLVPKAVATYEYTRASERGNDGEGDQTSLCERIGFAPEAFEAVAEMERKASEPEEEEQ
ncbi:MAG: hypothetical protein ACI364_05230 [Coriobacteriales bacterium]